MEDDNAPETFITALVRQDELGAVIRAQIYLEHELLEFLRERLAEPDALLRSDVSFARLVRLAVALGLPSELGKALHAFARIRNHFAHRLDSKLTEKIVNEFCNSFTTSMRKEADDRINHIHFLSLGGKSTRESLTTRGLFQMYSYCLWFMLLEHTEAHDRTDNNAVEYGDEHDPEC